MVVRGWGLYANERAVEVGSKSVINRQLGTTNTPFMNVELVLSNDVNYVQVYRDIWEGTCHDGNWNHRVVLYCVFFLEGTGAVCSAPKTIQTFNITNINTMLCSVMVWCCISDLSKCNLWQSYTEYRKSKYRPGMSMYFSTG